MKKVDKIIIIAILISVFFFRYIEVLYEPWYIFDAMLFLYVILNIFNKINFSKFFYFWLFITICFLLTIIIINIVNFGVGRIFFDNLLMTFTPIVLLIYVYYLVLSYPQEILYNLGKKILTFSNWYFWLNAPIIFLQFLTGSFMMGRFLSWGSYAFDHMTGLIGPFGTGILNVYWIVLLVGNILYYLISKSKKWLFHFILQIPAMLILSLFNEIKSFIPTLILFTILFSIFILSYKKITVKQMFGYSLFVITVGLLLVISYQSIDLIKQQVDKLIELALGFKSDAQLDTNNERAYINYLAFQYYNADTIGAGINSIDFNNQRIHRNLGINSMTLVLIHGGIMYFLGIINFYSSVIIMIFHKKLMHNTLVIFMVFLAIMGYLSFITQPFRDHYIMTMVAILVLFVSIYHNHIKKGE